MSSPSAPAADSPSFRAAARRMASNKSDTARGIRGRPRAESVSAIFPRGRPPRATFFKNLKSKNGPKAVPDSPTASATTGSHGSPFGSGNDSPFGNSRSSPYASSSPFGTSIGLFCGSGNASPEANLGIDAPNLIPFGTRVNRFHSGNNFSPVANLGIPASPTTPTAAVPPVWGGGSSPAVYGSSDGRFPISASAGSQQSPLTCGSSPSAKNSPSYSTVSTASSHYIDHTALLLGFREEFALGGLGSMGSAESDDNEREWNACFSPNISLDELDKKQKKEMAEIGDSSSKNKRGSEGGGSMNVHVGGGIRVQHDDSRVDDDSSDDGGLQLDIDCATPGDMPVTYSHDEIALPPSSASELPFPKKCIASKSTNLQQQLSRRSLQSYDEKELFATAPDSDSPKMSIAIKLATTTRDCHSDDFVSDIVCPAPNAWRHEVEEEVGNRKYTNPLEVKRRAARMKDLAMKKKASSALAAKTQKAKEKVHKLKETANRRKARRFQHQREQEQQDHQKNEHRHQQPNRMEITTISKGDTEVLSQVSYEIDESSASADHDDDAAASPRKLQFRSKVLSHIKSAKSQMAATKSQMTGAAESSDCHRDDGAALSPGKHQFKSRMLSQIASTKTKRYHRAGSRSVSSAASAVSSMRDKASSAISQKAQLAKEKTVGMILAPLGSPLMRATQNRRSSAMLIKRRSGLAAALPSRPSPSRDIVSVLSMEAASDATSVPNSEGTATVDSSGPIHPRASDVPMIETPKAISRKGGSLPAIEDLHTAETIPRSTVTGTDRGEEESGACILPPRGTFVSPSASMVLPPLYFPPPLALCPSDLSSSHAATDSSRMSCIDCEGFLISPAASFDGLADVAGGGCRGMGGEASKSVGSEEGAAAFDPNSFLFLSPLSDTDMDDPDYGMPELLSRSNGRNAAMMDATDGIIAGAAAAAGVMSNPGAAGAAGTPSARCVHGCPLSRLAPPLLPSPRLFPPSGKRTIRRVKGAATGRSGKHGFC